MDNLSVKDREIYSENKSKYFRGTIAVSVIYGVVALALLIVALLNENIKKTLQTSLMPFLLTLILGILLVIGFLLLMLFTYSPAKASESIYNKIDCPDYWTRSYDKNATEREKRITCTKPVDVNTLSPAYSLTSTGTLTADMATTLGVNNSGTLKCDTVHPMLFAKQDLLLSNDINTNALRCEYANKCGVPWTSACPNPT